MRNLWQDGHSGDRPLEQAPEEHVRVLIVGGGTAGWMSAAALSALLPARQVSITLVESEEIGTVGVGEATVPHIRYFNQRLGFDEADFMRRTKATFKLGIEFRDWARIGDSYIHPFGAFGTDIDNIPFHQHWLRAHLAGTGGALEEYSLPIIAARANRFAPPVEDPRSPLSTYSYAYQFDAALYAAYLRQYAERNGVQRIEGRIVDQRQNGESGFIESISLADGRMLEADLFVDCSGFRGLLIGQTPDDDFEDWSRWLPCDRAYAVQCDDTGPLTPYTRATAHDAGWFWRIPLQHRVGNGLVFSSEFMTLDDARNALLGQIESEPLTEPRLLRFKAGKRQLQWNRNVVTIGLSCGFLEPLESTSIHLIQLAIGYLVDLFPEPDVDPVNAAEFNRIMTLEFERIRDFLILHYHATERDDTPFWDFCRTMPIPDSLRERIELFRQRGVISNYREGMFLDASWYAVMFGQNVIPQYYDPRCDRLSDEELIRDLTAIRERYRGAVNGMSDHRQLVTALTTPGGAP